MYVTVRNSVISELTEKNCSLHFGLSGVTVNLKAGQCTKDGHEGRKRENASIICCCCCQGRMQTTDAAARHEKYSARCCSYTHARFELNRI